MVEPETVLELLERLPRYSPAEELNMGQDAQGDWLSRDAVFQAIQDAIDLTKGSE